MSFNIPQQLNATGAGVSGTYPNLVFQGAGLQPLAVGRVHIGDIPPSVTTHAITFGTALLTSSYIVILTVISLGTVPADDVQVQAAVISSTIATTGFTVQLRETAALVQNIDIAYVVYPV